MTRRQFIFAIATLAGSLPVFSKAHVLQSSAFGVEPEVDLNDASVEDIVTSIHAGFGSNFKLVSANTVNGQTICSIEHHGNVYQVSSSNHIDWRINDSTPI